jgi:hypothetical protein
MLFAEMTSVVRNKVHGLYVFHIRALKAVTPLYDKPTNAHFKASSITYFRIPVFRSQ